MNLTKKQIATLTFIDNYKTLYDFAPSMREIAQVFGITVKGAYDRIESLVKKGYIKKGEKIARSISIIKDFRGE